MLRDQVEGFELKDDILRKHSNEANAIGYLFYGLEYLYSIVKQAEPAGSHATGGTPDATTASPAVRVCSFHWYATTACNLVKTIGWIHQRQDANAPEPEAYLETVLPAVKAWRNKVSAHFAFHTPHKSDTPADEFASIIPPTALVNGRYIAGAFTVQIRRQGQVSQSKLKPWSVTQVHEQLRSRYGIFAEARSDVSG